MPAPRRARLTPVLFVTALLAACAQPAPPPAAAAAARPALPSVALKETGAFPLPAHLESADIAGGKYDFGRLFTAGEALFHTNFNGLDGVGGLQRLDGTPVRRFALPNGPATQGCAECHNTPAAAAGGLAHESVVHPVSKTSPLFDVRAVTSLFGDGILQLLAQEMTEELQAARDEAIAAAKAAPGTVVVKAMESKGTSFGSIAVKATAAGTVTTDVSKLVGIDPDLVVRPMGWKGDSPIVRNVTAGASFGGMGMQGEEILWKLPKVADPLKDADGDGVARELSVGDITAMTIYSAAQETPTELGRLATLGYVQPPSAEDAARIEAGRKLFTEVGCASCHRPEMPLTNTRFEEPTARGNGNYYDAALAKLDPNFDPKRPAAFDILTDAQPPRAGAREGGGAIIRLYGDLKRHAMGRTLADPSGPGEPETASGDQVKFNGKVVTIPADVFLTAELWGTGNTGPWMHDNRAGTLREAILVHGEDQPPALGKPGRSEAQESRDAFKKKPAADQDALVAFLLSLRTFSPEPK